MRVVVDTNVLIAGVLWDGPPHRIIELAEAGKVTLCASPAILTELGGVLRRRKFLPRLRLRRTSVEEIMARLVPLVELYVPGLAPGSVPADPDDEIFVACALAAQAGVIVSGNGHLLRLHRYESIRIVSPAEFAREFQAALGAGR